MTTALAVPAVEPAPMVRRHWLAALAMLFVLLAPYQTLIQTVLTDDAVRKGLDIDEYDMTWQQVGYGVGILYGLFAGLWLSARIGARTPSRWVCWGSPSATCCAGRRSGCGPSSWAGSSTASARCW